MATDPMRVEVVPFSPVRELETGPGPDRWYATATGRSALLLRWATLELSARAAETEAQRADAAWGGDMEDGDLREWRDNARRDADVAYNVALAALTELLAYDAQGGTDAT